MVDLNKVVDKVKKILEEVHNNPDKYVMTVLVSEIKEERHIFNSDLFKKIFEIDYGKIYPTGETLHDKLRIIKQVKEFGYPTQFIIIDDDFWVIDGCTRVEASALSFGKLGAVKFPIKCTENEENLLICVLLALTTVTRKYGEKEFLHLFTALSKGFRKLGVEPEEVLQYLEKVAPPQFTSLFRDLAIAFSQIKTLDVPNVIKDEFIAELPNLYSFIKKYRVTLAHPDLVKLLMYIVHYVNVFLHYDQELKNAVLDVCVANLTTVLESFYTIALIEKFRKFPMEIPALASIEFACYELCVGDEFRFNYLYKNPEYKRFREFIHVLVNSLLKMKSGGRVESYLLNQCLKRLEMLDFSKDKVMLNSVKKVLEHEELRKYLLANLKPTSVVPTLLYVLAPKLQNCDPDVKKFLDINYIIEKFKISKPTIFKGIKVLRPYMDLVEKLIKM